METKGAQTLHRSLDILETLCVENKGLGVTELARRLDLNKSTVHRLLAALESRGYVEHTQDGLSYQLGLKLIEMSCFKLNHLELQTEAKPYLYELTHLTGQPVHLSIRMENEVVYIDKVESINNFRMYSQIGRRTHMETSAVGKALLFDLTETELRELAATFPFEPRTESSIRSVDQLLQEIKVSRERGWALDNMENEPGIRCIGAPIRDYRGVIIAAVSTSGPGVTQDKFEEFAGHVKRTAQEISRRMGYNNDYQ